MEMLNRTKLIRQVMLLMFQQVTIINRKELHNNDNKRTEQNKTNTELKTSKSKSVCLERIVELQKFLVEFGNLIHRPFNVFKEIRKKKQKQEDFYDLV